MKTTELNQQERDVIEAMIDKHNLDMVLLALSKICADKAEHIHDNWQNTRLANHWLTACSNIAETYLPDVPGIKEPYTDLEPVAD